MKKLILILSIVIFPNVLLAQQAKPQPLIIKGRITNCPEKQLTMFFVDANQQLAMDTMKLDKDGNFYLKTYKIKNPQKTIIKQNSVQIRDIYVAPGYDLTITGDGSDFITLLKTKKIAGIGGKSNRYKMLMDSITLARNDRTEYFSLKEADLLAYVKAQRQLKDSVANVVFGKVNAISKPATLQKTKNITDKVNLSLIENSDKYLAYFSKMTRYDTEFSAILMLIDHTNWQKFNAERSVTFVSNNADPNIWNNMFREGYMVSEVYSLLMRSEYLKFIIRLDRLKNPSINDSKWYDYKKVNASYNGPIRGSVLYYKMDYAIDDVKSLAELNDYKNAFKHYLVTINPQMQKSISKHFSEKEVDLIKTEVGKPAPKFMLLSNTGKRFSLDDFKGKVLYLDMWASWCGPCRAENPAFTKLYRKYKDDDRVAFISIAVHDGVNDWKKALAEDKPEWLQLLDKDGKVAISYAANAIPKFILVDKKGNIVSFDALRPSEGKQTEDMLLAEMVK
jgi:thiol-disulfide isomerase/thioredoxin